jgi:hypothetical protein
VRGREPLSGRVDPIDCLLVVVLDCVYSSNSLSSNSLSPTNTRNLGAVGISSPTILRPETHCRKCVYYIILKLSQLKTAAAFIVIFRYMIKAFLRRWSIKFPWSTATGRRLRRCSRRCCPRRASGCCTPRFHPLKRWEPPCFHLFQHSWTFAQPGCTHNNFRTRGLEL